MAGPARAQPSLQYPFRFRIGEQIGSEDGMTEFKDGPGFIQNDFRSSVAKYVSAFINSHENGRLFLGVNDGGHVTGYRLNQSQEDRLRLHIYDAIKDIEPSIFVKDCSVAFTPVADENGYFDARSTWLSVVICIMVHGSRINTNGQLYSTLQGTFMRKDGRVQILNAQDIHNFYQRSKKIMSLIRGPIMKLTFTFFVPFNKYQLLENDHKQKEESLERENRDLLVKTTEQLNEIEKLKRQRDKEVRRAEVSRHTIEEIHRTIIESQYKESKD